MKPLSMFGVAAATSLLVFTTSFSKPGITNEIGAKAAATAGATAQVGNLFWYIDNGTVYHDWVSPATETTELEDEYGVLVDTNPVGGTLLSSGYPFYGYPHLIFASSYLYGHF